MVTIDANMLAVATYPNGTSWMSICPVQELEWTHITWTWELTTGAALFINGSKCGSSRKAQKTTKISQSHNDFVLGRRSAIHDSYGNFKIDEFRFVSQLLSEEVVQLQFEGKPK